MPDNRQFQQQWCKAQLRLTCQLLMFVLVALCSEQAGAEPNRLRVVSYNVWGVPNITPQRQARIAAIGQQLAAMDADVVALQEVWESEDVAVLEQAMTRAGLPHQQQFGVEGAAEKKSGLWLASRYPIVHSEFHAFQAGREILFPWHVDWMATKGYGLVQVKTPMGDVVVANTHLQSAYVFYDYAFIRLFQALEMGEALAQRDADTPLIAVGDFNDVLDSPAMRAMIEGAGMQPASDEFDIDAVLARAPAGRTVEATEVRHLFEQPQPLANGDELALSDHPCVVVDYRIHTCDGCQAPQKPKRQQFLRETCRLLTDEHGATGWTLWLTRLAAFPLVALGWYASRRKIQRRWPRVALWLALLLTCVWCLNAGFVWVPAKRQLLRRYADAMQLAK